MGLFLTNIELEELTGYKLANKQASWLKCRGYYVETNVRGVPRITYLQVEEMRRNNTLSNSIFPNSQHHSNSVTQSNLHQYTAHTIEPDFNGLRKKINKVDING